MAGTRTSDQQQQVFLIYSTADKEIARRVAESLSTHAMKKLKIVLLSETEQSEIVTYFKSFDQKIVVASRRKVAALQNLFRTILHDLMTAKIRVHNLNLIERR